MKKKTKLFIKIPLGLKIYLLKFPCAEKQSLIKVIKERELSKIITEYNLSD